MDIEFSDGKIAFDKVLSGLDKFVVDFCRVLNSHDIKYVVVSGYVSIVFGRSRNTEDVDILIEKMPKNRFEELWNSLKDYECLNATNAAEGYEYLSNDTAIRFSKKGMFIPNMEMKFVKTSIDTRTLSNAVELVVNKNRLLISPLEIQISYKLFLGSEKDIEDARFLFKLFREHIDDGKLIEFLKELELDINKSMNYLGWRK